MAGMKNVILASRTVDEDQEICMRGKSAALHKLVTNFELNLDTNKIEPVREDRSRQSKSTSNHEDVKEEDDLIKELSVGAQATRTELTSPDDDLVLELFKQAGDAVNFNPDEEGLFQASAAPLRQELLDLPASANKEGEAIMAGISGFGGMIESHASQQHNQGQVPYGWTLDKMPYVKIIEQPAENKLRFRYECEGRSAGALHGINHTADNKTFPTIQIIGYKGPAVVVVSCVEDKAPYRTHPHNLVGKDGMCKKGVCSVDFNNPEMTVSFQNLGIQCVKRRDAPASLTRREQIQVDPFKQGFKHKHSSINLNVIRLCFQVFLKTSDRGLVPLVPVVSNVIRDKKSHSDLQIIDYSDDTSPVEGGKKILLFCEKVYKDDIEVHFTLYTKGGEQVTRKGEFTANDVHKQHGISLRTPAYPDQNITTPVQVAMYLYKPSEKSTSDPVEFWYSPKIGKKDNHQEMMNNQKAKSNMKRERERHINRNHDDPSSGMINVPPKITPEQLRGAGGQVSVVRRSHQDGNVVLPPPPPVSIYNNYGETPGMDPITSQSYSSFITNVAASTSHASHVGYGDGQLISHVSNIMSPPDQAFSNMQHHIVSNVRLDEGQAGHQQQQVHPSGSGADRKNKGSQGQQTDNSPKHSDFVSQVVNTSEFISASMSLTNIDINTADLENLSSNLGMNLRLEKGTEGNTKGQRSCHNEEVGEINRKQLGDGLDRQSSQLHTPDVSLVSLDSDSNKKNNLNLK